MNRGAPENGQSRERMPCGGVEGLTRHSARPKPRPLRRGTHGRPSSILSPILSPSRNLSLRHSLFRLRCFLEYTRNSLGEKTLTPWHSREGKCA